ncbi:MAG: class I SAM-dependent methyltransferase [Nitrososphaera sp.]|uniref:class I SAM-dependent methyltransferase n=1 Tax=Nitrososphaera sp. TaxID=1971748 RepID=UPI003175E41A
MVSISPLQAIMWTFRRSERDVVNLYNSLSPVMQLATGGDMLNFGYWEGARDPIDAQRRLCSLVGDIAGLASAKMLVDVGSGLGAPAAEWRAAHGSEIVCVNINKEQLLLSAKPDGISFVNATSTALPFSDRSADRIVALESAQHFRPLERFIAESRRILKDDGILVMALPVMKKGDGHMKAVTRLGILSFTWSSEHYGLEYVKSAVAGGGFAIDDIRHIGHQVYEPLTDYYVKNRQALRENILKEYSSFIEGVLYRSLLKMKDASEKCIIDYVIIKALRLEPL